MKPSQSKRDSQRQPRSTHSRGLIYSIPHLESLCLWLSGLFLVLVLMDMYFHLQQVALALQHNKAGFPSGFRGIIESVRWMYGADYDPDLLGRTIRGFYISLRNLLFILLSFSFLSAVAGSATGLKLLSGYASTHQPSRLLLTFLRSLILPPHRLSIQYAIATLAYIVLMLSIRKIYLTLDFLPVLLLILTSGTVILFLFYLLSLFLTYLLRNEYFALAFPGAIFSVLVAGLFQSSLEYTNLSINLWPFESPINVWDPFVLYRQLLSSILTVRTGFEFPRWIDYTASITVVLLYTLPSVVFLHILLTSLAARERRPRMSIPRVRYGLVLYQTGIYALLLPAVLIGLLVVHRINQNLNEIPSSYLLIYSALLLVIGTLSVDFSLLLMRPEETRNISTDRYQLRTILFGRLGLIPLFLAVAILAGRITPFPADQTISFLILFALTSSILSLLTLFAFQLSHFARSIVMMLYILLLIIPPSLVYAAFAIFNGFTDFIFVASLYTSAYLNWGSGILGKTYVMAAALALFLLLSYLSLRLADRTSRRYASGTY